MKTISSFMIDHTKLKSGLYVSRVDSLRRGTVTTFDLRMKTPYVDEPLRPEAAHAIEHCLATYLRNRRDDIVYVGVMGCMTGFYVLVWGKCSVGQIKGSLIDAFKWITETDTIPGATKIQCGNYQFMDLADAKKEAEQYLEVLSAPY